MSKILSLASELSLIREIKRNSGRQRSRGLEVPRGIRNNNPGNIEKNPANAWEGRVPLANNTDGRFEQFTSYSYGVRALILLLRTYINSGKNTISDIFSHYAPVGENNTQKYIQFVAERLGVSPTAVITLSKSVLRELAQAIAKMENGQDCISNDQFEEGWNLVSTEVKNSIAKSLSYQEGYSYPFYDTGEHSILGQYIAGISASPIASVPVLQPGKTFNINGVLFTYGQIVTMGDFFDSYTSLKSANATQLTALKNLIIRSETYYTNSILLRSSGVQNPGNKDWSDASSQYLILALKNNSHFAPPLPGSTVLIRENHKLSWEDYHNRAIQKARSGNSSAALEEAYPINAFGDHFLTDAFAAGHLFNKEIVMQRFLNNCFSGGKLTSAADTMLERIADGALKDPKTKAELSKWETHSGAGAATAVGGVVGGPIGALVAKKIVGQGLDLDTTTPVKVFYRVLKGILEDSTGRIEIANLAAKAVHDFLNNYPGGLPVMNNKGIAWKLTGDGRLNKDNVSIIQLAVKQSVENIPDSVTNMSKPVSAYFKQVWDYVPDVNLGNTKSTVESTISNFTNPSSNDLVNKAIELLKDELPLLLDKLKDRKMISLK